MAVYIAAINSSVHIVMYSYYYLSSFKNELLQRILKWVKPLITIIQLVQFVIIIVHCTIAALPSCNASFFFDINIINFSVLFYLFGKFFVETYIKSDKSYNLRSLV